MILLDLYYVLRPKILLISYNKLYYKESLLPSFRKNCITASDLNRSSEYFNIIVKSVVRSMIEKLVFVLWHP